MTKKYAIKPLYPDWHITDDYYKYRLGFIFYIYETVQFELGSQFLLYYTGKPEKVKDKYGVEGQYSIIGLAESIGDWTNEFSPCSPKHPMSLPVSIKLLLKNLKVDRIPIRKYQKICSFNPADNPNHRHYFEFKKKKHFDEILAELIDKDCRKINDIPKDFTEYFLNDTK